jgi:hypothetical protein
MPRDPWGLDEDEAVSPAVIGPDYVGDDEEDDEFEPAPQAPSAYVPCKSAARGTQDAKWELRYTEDDELALFAYSDPERLMACCGDGQPWVAVPVAELDALAARTGAAVILRDEKLPA